MAQPEVEQVVFLKSKNAFERFQFGEFTGYIGLLREVRDDPAYPSHLRRLTTNVSIRKNDDRMLLLPVEIGPGCMTPKVEAIHQAVSQFVAVGDSNG